MTVVRDVIQHIIRTLLLVGATAALCALVILVTIYWKWSPYVMFAALMAIIVAVVYGTARWHPYWAPIVKQVARIPWQHTNGTAMVTIVEKALVHAGSTQETYRVSIYALPGHHLVRRQLIGDLSTQWLGVWETGLWFYIGDRFYARRDGIVCLDLQTAAWRYHLSKSEATWEDQDDDQRHLIEVIRAGRSEILDLRFLPPRRVGHG